MLTSTKQNKQASTSPSTSEELISLDQVRIGDIVKFLEYPQYYLLVEKIDMDPGLGVFKVAAFPMGRSRLEHFVWDTTTLWRCVRQVSTSGCDRGVVHLTFSRKL